MAKISYSVGIGRNPLLRAIYRDIKIRRRHAMVLIVGDPGSGKSALAISLAKRFDRSFNIKERLALSLEQFANIVINMPVPKRTLDRGKAIVVDEFQIMMNARTWYDRLQKAVGNLLETIRYKNLAIFMTSQFKENIDIVARRLFNYLVVAKGVTLDGKIVYKTYVMKKNFLKAKIFPTLFRINGMPVKYVKSPFPEKLYQEYLKFMIPFKQEVEKKVLEEIKKRDKSEEESMMEKISKIKQEILDNINFFKRSSRGKYTIDVMKVKLKYNIPLRLANMIARDIREIKKEEQPNLWL